MSHFFDATTEYLQENNGLIANEPLTISCFYYPTSHVSATLVALGLQSGTAGSWKIMTLVSGAVQCRKYDSVGTNWFVNTVNLCTLNSWNHVVVSCSSDANFEVILNGSTAATDNGTSIVVPTTDRWRIGVDTDTSLLVAGAWRIAQVGVWNVILNAPEKKMLSYGVSPVRIRPSALVRFVPVWGFSSVEPCLVSNAPASMVVNGSPTPSPHAPYSGSPFFPSDWTFPRPRVDVVKNFSAYDSEFPKFLLRKTVPLGRVL